MSEQGNHTPGKLRIAGGSSSYIDIAGNTQDAVAAGVPTAQPGEVAQTPVCRVHRHSQGRANADRIVRSWNCHDDLLAACKAAKSFMEVIGNPAPPHPWMQIRDAIAKAEAQP